MSANAGSGTRVHECSVAVRMVGLFAPTHTAPAPVSWCPKTVAHG